MPIEDTKRAISRMPEEEEDRRIASQQERDKKLNDRALQMMEEDPESRRYFDADATDIDHFMETKGNEEAKKRYGHNISDEDMDAVEYGHRNGLFDDNYKQNYDVEFDEESWGKIYLPMTEQEKADLQSSRAKRKEEEQKKKQAEFDKKQRVENRKRMLNKFLGIKN